MQAGKEIARTVCSCGRKLVVWPYTSCLTNEQAGIEWGDTLAAIVCEHCDATAKFPRFGSVE